MEAAQAGPVRHVDLGPVIDYWRALHRCDPIAAGVFQAMIRTVLVDETDNMFTLPS